MSKILLIEDNELSGLRMVLAIARDEQANFLQSSWPIIDDAEDLREAVESKAKAYAGVARLCEKLGWSTQQARWMALIDQVREILPEPSPAPEKVPNILTLDLEHGTDLRGPLFLYIFHRDGKHAGAMRFDARSGKDSARMQAERHVALNREVRITNCGDFLVFHAKDGKVLFPPDAEAFWRDAGK